MPQFSKITLIGVGQMGGAMAAHLTNAAEELVLFDLDMTTARAVAESCGAAVAPSLRAAAGGCDLAITMLPNAEIVREVLFGRSDSLSAGLAEGAVVVDMGSSYPPTTRRSGEELADRGITLLDAPVSGGVAKAKSGGLAIMLGGDAPGAMDRAQPALETMGRVFRTGPLGSGHALKALNNFVSAAGLAAACEAVIVGQRFGLDPAVMVDVFNASTGRNNSTEVKLRPFILSGSFASGFALDLMRKDLKAAADLAAELGLALPSLQQAAVLWAEARAGLGEGRDHTEIFRYLERHAETDE